MDYKNWLQSKTFAHVLTAIGIALGALLIFQAGVFVGYHKAAFSYRWGDNYYRAFGRPHGEFLRGMPRGDFPGAHGVAGRIIKIDPPTFLLEGQDRIEKEILMQADTIIRRGQDTIQPTDLKADDYVVVIGSPNDKAQVAAKFIRLVPPPQ